MDAFHLKTVLLVHVFVLFLLPMGRSEAEEQLAADGTAMVPAESDQWAGLCVQIGGSLRLTKQLSGNPQLLLHRMDTDAKAAGQARRWIADHQQGATILAEQWTGTDLPHADNLVNVVIASEDSAISRAEILRVLCPGGVAYLAGPQGYSRTVKPRPAGLDDWTHQWHGADGGLVTTDTHVDVPRGLQWVAGPLFAMAGRKSSTQSLVSAGGLNFYVTQNVAQNVGRTQMDQFLVARDAFNGLLLWQRSWSGPFVTGRGETNPRVVASSNHVYVVDSGRVQALDARTGEVNCGWETDEVLDKLLHVGHLLLVQSPQGIRALDERLSGVAWEFRDQTTHDTVASGDQVYCLVSGRSQDGRFQHDLVGIRLDDGQVSWRVNTQPHTSGSRLRINFAADGLIALQASGSLHLFSAKSGEHLWTRLTDARPGKTYVDERYVGHFYRHGLVWMLRKNSPRELSGQNEWVGLDPLTGQRQRTLRTKGDWPRTATPAKMGCQLLVASDRYIMIPRQATFVDFATGEKRHFKFSRGGCGSGFVPANGLVYTHPHACGCFSEAVRGFMGLHSRETVGLRVAGAGRVERGPAYGQVTGPPTSPEDWPLHRYDGRRGACSPVQLDTKLSLSWSEPVVPRRDTVSSRAWTLRSGSPLSAPTIYGETVFVADVDRGKLHALDVASGSPRWTYSAAGRIDSPPTLHKGLCLVGAHDGYVYCLRARDGKLVWRFRAAPVDSRMVAFGNVESRWPVSGTVLVHGNVALVAAGRAPDADGGLQVHALDLATGSPRWSAEVNSPEFVGLCDFLVAGEESVFLSNWQFDARTGAQRKSENHAALRGGKVGLLEASWMKHDLALRKNIQTWTAGDVAGQLLAFSQRGSVRYEAPSRTLAFQGKTAWKRAVPKPAQVTALMLTGSHVVVGGSRDRQAELPGGMLWLIDKRDGAIVSTAQLRAEVSFDGLAVARGRIFASTRDGRLLCFGP